MWSSERRALLGLALLGTAASLAGCGFARQQAPQMSFSRIALTGFAPRSPLAAELRRQLAERLQVVESPAQAQVVLQALEDRREKSIVASTSAAQVREFQVRVKLAFRAHTPGGRELIAPAELLLERDLSYSESLALAKQDEEAALYREMQADVVAQVLRRLAAIQL